MPIQAGGKTTPLHFLSDTVEEAIDHLSGQYPDFRQKAANNKAFTRLFLLDCNHAYADELLQVGFGGEIVGDGSPVSFTIGLVGKMWAMLCLLPLSKTLQSEAKRTPHSAAYSILGYGCEEDRARLLSLLIKTTTTDYSSKKNKLAIRTTDIQDFYKLIRDLAIECLLTANISGLRMSIGDKLDNVLDQPHASPEACAEVIFREFELSTVKHGPWEQRATNGPMHDFEPVLQQFIDNEVASERDADPDLERSIDSVLNKLIRYRTNPKKPHIALVVGDEQSGKKSVVGDLLRKLRAQTTNNAPITFNLRYADTVKMRLPILAISLRNHDYGSLAAYVLAFLLRANGELGADVDLAEEARVLKRRYIKGDVFDDIIKLIEQEHAQCAVMFIFLDAQGLDRDSLQRVLQYSGLYQLLVKLWQSNNQSRYLVTATKIDFVHAPPELRLKKNSIVQIPTPKIKRFAWYLSTNDLHRFRQPDPTLPLVDGAVQSPEDALNAFARSLDAELPVTGDVLLAMSALYAAGVDNKTFLEIGKTYLKDQNSPNQKYPAQGESKIYQALIDILDHQDILLPITLIAATRFTGDVLTTSSLKELCYRYYAEAKQEDFEVYWNKTAAKLNIVAEGARTLFISKYPQVRNDPEEMGFLEERLELRQNWHMSAALATAFMQRLLDEEEQKKLAKDTFRLIATAARRRAQLKRIRRSDDSGSSDRGEIARDIQCYIALLASLPDEQSAYDGNKFGAIANRALRLSLDEVFTTGQDFNAVHAMRFAVQCVLRQDIDEGYRLSMVTDQDELRLRLYLLIFFPIGKLHTWTIAQFRNRSDAGVDILPTQLPRHVTDLFDPETCLELLLTVALAAYHSQLPHIVAWSWAMSRQIPYTKIVAERQRHLALRARIAGTIVDAGIASGKSIVEAGGLLQVLEWTENQSEPLLKEIGFDPIKKDADVASLLPVKLQLVQARMRLAAREAELNWIARDDLLEAKKIYSQLEQLEHLIARHIDQAEPVVLSGRTARRYARLLCRDYPVFAEPWFKDNIPTAPPSITRKIRHVIEANIGRLNSYAGADRIGVLVDQARRHCIGGKLQLALHYIEDAYKRLESSRISHGGRLDVLAVNAGLHLVLAEKALAINESPQHHLLKASILIKMLEEIGTKLNFDAPLVVSEFLKARVIILDNAHKGYALLDNGASKTLDRCIKLAISCGYRSAESMARQWKELAI